jgi:SPX domain protein involved in polyphosphate accumulation
VWQRPERARHELKYVVDLSTAKSFLNEVSRHCVLDLHSGASGSYEVASLYYDTNDLRFYWDRQESLGYRRKVRVRSYNADGSCTGIFLEIKEKHKSLVAKKRVKIISLPDNSLSDRHDRTPFDIFLKNANEDEPVIKEALYLHKRLSLYPVSIVRYIRSTLIGVREPDVRITLDERITTGGPDIFAHTSRREVFIHPADQAILEIKADYQLPRWLYDIVANYSLVQQRFSKYCLAVNALYGSNPKILCTSLIDNLPTQTNNNLDSDSLLKTVA